MPDPKKPTAVKHLKNAPLVNARGMKAPDDRIESRTAARQRSGAAGLLVPGSKVTGTAPISNTAVADRQIYQMLEAEGKASHANSRERIQGGVGSVLGHMVTGGEYEQELKDRGVVQKKLSAKQVATAPMFGKPKK
jgi:hypothetical protein